MLETLPLTLSEYVTVYPSRTKVILCQNVNSDRSSIIMIMYEKKRILFYLEILLNKILFVSRLFLSLLYFVNGCGYGHEHEH